MPTWDQIKGIVERLIVVGLTYLATKGYIELQDVATYGPAILALAAAGWAAWVNRPKAIVQSAAALPNTTVVTTPEIAHNTPELNIVSSELNKVEPKTAADLNFEQLAKVERGM